ncbi:hypothetical protein C1645_749579 [Glomus cerebriforme]|uniref:Uncharacterized protein n=1 Tax=Glomus cerebriforme TaxID=658196 RepID=A0A397TJY3_9GLOM|nr:hypothetical protein C1645_749579 [Glomus cerebriforme]
MPSHYIYIPILVLSAPLILSVIGTFTALAIVTSSLALIVISIRLGFLAIEFSGGVVLDFIKWGIDGILGENPYKRKKKNIKDEVIIDTTIINKSQNQPHNGKKHIKITTKLTPKMAPLLETKTTEFYTPNGSGNNFYSNDDYFMMSMIANNKRPNGRRARSDYI